MKLRQASTEKGLPFGGYNIILVGDIGQLKPVGGTSLYTANKSTTYSLYRDEFKTVVIWKEKKRQNQADPTQRKFIQMVENMRNHCVTQDDWNLLVSRQPDQLSAEARAPFKNALRVKATNQGFSFLFAEDGCGDEVFW